MSIQQQLNAPDMNHWRTSRKHSTKPNTEVHFTPACKYIKLMDWIIRGAGLRNSILLRHCECDQEYEDRSEVQHKKVLYSSEFGDGVEIHFYTEENEQNCKYHSVIKKDESGQITYEHSKHCFCPRVLS